MKALITTGTATLALLLGGCGSEADEGNNALATAANSGPIEAIPAPNGGDWTDVVSETPEGGIVMGNPNAPVKVVEFASMTCPHCADFATTGFPELRDEYIKTGQVSLELRNFVRDPADLAAAILARCGGATPYFKLTEQIFANQDEWFEKLQAMTPAQQQRLEGLPPTGIATALAEQAGLIDFVRLRGVPEEKARQCLADQATLEKLTEMTASAAQQYQIPGTPSFLINGKLVDNAANWEALEPHIRAAIG